MGGPCTFTAAPCEHGKGLEGNGKSLISALFYCKLKTARKKRKSVQKQNQTKQTTTAHPSSWKTHDSFLALHGNALEETEENVSSALEPLP